MGIVWNIKFNVSQCICCGMLCTIGHCMLAGVQCHTTLLACYVMWVLYCNMLCQLPAGIAAIALYCMLSTADITTGYCHCSVLYAIALSCCPCTMGGTMDVGTVIAYTILPYVCVFIPYTMHHGYCHMYAAVSYVCNYMVCTQCY